MNAFVQKDLYVSEIALATYVPPNTGKAVHHDRLHHGIVMSDNTSKKTYTFANGQTCVIERGDVLYLPQHSDYVVSTQQYGGVYAINFELTTDEIFEPFVLKMSAPKTVLELFRDAERVWRIRRPGYHYRCVSDLMQILAAIKSEMYSPYIPQSKATVLAPAMEMIEEGYASENIQISQLAESCGISDVYFRKIFQQVHGTTPRKYIRDLKLSLAKELLLSGEYAVHEVSVLCGYSDDCYFSREFKKATGLAPSDFKRSVTDPEKI